MDIVEKIQKQSRLRHSEPKSKPKVEKKNKPKFANERVRKLYQKKYNKARSKKRKQLRKEKIKSEAQLKKELEREAKQKEAGERLLKLQSVKNDEHYIASIQLKYTMVEPEKLSGEEGLLCSHFGCGKKLSMIEKLSGRTCTSHMNRNRNPF